MERYTTGPNLADMMFERARRWPDRARLRFWRDGAWQGLTWAQFAAQVASAARALRAAGVCAGDRVLLVSENRPEFPVAELALMAIRAVPVPAYTTYTVADHAHVLGDSGARVAIVSTAALAGRLAAAGPLDLMVTMEPFAHAGLTVTPWDELLGAVAVADVAGIEAEAATIPPGALACLIYTSGTGGTPRGVMLPHRAILANCHGAARLVAPLEFRDEVYLSFLPLSHAYEHTAGQFFLLSVGCEVVYARGVDHLAADMAAIRPTIMTFVPRILEVIRARVLAQVEREKPWRRALFERAVELGRKRAEEGLSWPERAQDAALERLVRRKVRARFGGRFRAAMSGGARLEPAVGRFFMGLGIELLQGYGQTEAGPVISANTRGATDIETVGRPLDGVEVHIAADGEILIRGDLVMDGYWGRPDETAQAIRDGWLHTGDIGALDSRGYLRITDRKRDMIVLSGGENVSPARVEGLLADDPAVLQAVVAGEGRSGLVALIVAQDGADAGAVAAAVKRVNQSLSVTERIRRHAIVAPFTIENGLLTATQKVRRHLVLTAHRAALDVLNA